MRDKTKIGFHVILCLCFLVFVFASFGYALRQLLFPVVVLGIAILASVLKLIALFNPQWATRLDPQGIIEVQSFHAVQPDVAMASASDGMGTPKRHGPLFSFGVVGCWILGTLAAIYLLGFIVGTGIATFVYVGFIDPGGGGRLKTAVMTLLVPTTLYLVFEVLLQVEIYRGLFG